MLDGTRRPGTGAVSTTSAPPHSSHRRSRYGRALLRIASLLALLALVAERAAGRSVPVRIVVLAVLRHAEAVARCFVAEETRFDLSCLEDGVEQRGHPVEAAWLALRFRLLAAMLADLVEAGCRLQGREPFAARGAALRVGPVLPLLLPALRRPRPRDTS